MLHHEKKNKSIFSLYQNFTIENSYYFHVKFSVSPCCGRSSNTYLRVSHFLFCVESLFWPSWPLAKSISTQGVEDSK